MIGLRHFSLDFSFTFYYFTCNISLHKACWASSTLGSQTGRYDGLQIQTSRCTSTDFATFRLEWFFTLYSVNFTLYFTLYFVLYYVLYISRSGYPVHLQYKLLQRHAKCLCELGKYNNKNNKIKIQ